MIAIRSVGVACAAGVGDERVLDPARAASLAPPPSLPRFADRRVAAAASFDPERYVTARKSLKLMNRASRLAVAAAREALPPPDDRERAGLFLGVGMSGGEIAQLAGLLDASLDERGAIDPAAMGARGLPSLNPLLSFHVLNNMPLCHTSIELGIGGPHAAIYAEGGEALQAIDRAAHAVAAGAPWALAGGADCPLSTVGLALADPGAPLGEGAALLVLAPTAGDPGEIRWLGLEEQDLHSASGQDLHTTIALDGEAARLFPRAIALPSLVGDTRAASGALGAALAVRLLRDDPELPSVAVAWAGGLARIGRRG